MIVSVPISQLPSATQPLSGSETIVMNQNGITTTSDLSAIKSYSSTYPRLEVTEDSLGSGIATLGDTAFERTIVPDATVTKVILPVGAADDVGRALRVYSSNSPVEVSDYEYGAFATVDGLQLMEVYAVSFYTRLDWTFGSSVRAEMGGATQLATLEDGDKFPVVDVSNFNLLRPTTAGAIWNYIKSKFNTFALLNSVITDADLVASTDGRLTDSREWSANTVLQAEAEAGTDTTRKAWTAERVFQAIAAKINAGATWAGVHAFSSTTRPTSAGTGTPATNSLITLADAQSAYGTEYNIFLSADLEAVSTDVVTGGQTITVPAGNYELEAHVGVLTASETGGAQGGFKVSANNDSSCMASNKLSLNIAGNGSSSTPAIAIRSGSSVLQYTMETWCDAPNNAGVGLTKAFITLSAETTFSPSIKQRTATDASNAAKLLKHSYLKLTKR